MNVPAKPPELPLGYHVENLSTLLHSVMDQYADLLSEDELQLFERFNVLSASAKSLFCRLLTRQGTMLRQDKLNYVDVPDLENTLTELEQTGLCSCNHPVTTRELLNLLTRSELIDSFQPQGHSKLNKPNLIELILDTREESGILQLIQSRFPYTEAHFQQAFETYKLCFFGNSHQDLTEFVISELGHVHYEHYSLCRETRFFQTREQIEHQLLYAKARQQLEDKPLLQDAEQLMKLALSLPQPDQHPHLQRRYQKTLLPIARQLERLEQWEDALTLFRHCDRHPSRERQARILKKLGRLDESLALCQHILAVSQHPEELEFVSRFLLQLQKALGTKTKPKKNTKWQETRLALTNGDESVEWIAAAALSDSNHLCCYVENTLFNGLFGLLFWDIIFAAIPGAFINPFQRGPLDLSGEDFYQRRKSLVDDRLEQLNSTEWQHTIRRHYETKQGLTNPFVFWEALPPELLELAINRIPPQHLQSIFARILQHPGLYRNGFPDLIRFSTDYRSDTPYELIEVKGPGDKLQANQIRWLQEFASNDIPASVCWVTWKAHD